MRRKHGAYAGRAHAAVARPTHMYWMLDTDPAMQQGRTLTTAMSATELSDSLTLDARSALANCFLDGIDAGTCPDHGVQCIVADEP